MIAERQSNIELLRICSMFALLFLHFCVFCLPHSIHYATQTGFWAHFPKIICSFMTLQVNIFVLISGWFGIRTTWQKVLKFYLICAFYSLIIYCLSLLLPGNVFSFKNAIVSILPFSFLPGWWFVKAYLFLMLLAPVFNKAIEFMSKREFLWALCALTLINVYCGFFARQSINPHGCNFMQVMYVYFIGRYLALHFTYNEEKLRKWSAIGSVVGVALYAIVWIANDEYFHFVKSLTFFNNNNPWSMFNSIAIFLFFTTIHFKSRSINWLANGVFAIYLIHTSVWISNDWNHSLITLYDSYSPFVAWSLLTILFLLYSILVLCFDHVRACITNSIVDKIDNHVNSHHLHI